SEGKDEQTRSVYEVNPSLSARVGATEFDLSLFLFVGVICRFFVPCSIFYNGIYFHFKAKIPIFVVTTQTIIQN
ncbi:MAG: hypothetical protein IIW44_07530, partial [Alistipes sp.]|nr:hypothetical protein [Alistipes sp.]